VDRRRGNAAGVVKEGSMFFFEKKNQKTFPLFAREPHGREAANG
jgi:hypothetical protein